MSVATLIALGGGALSALFYASTLLGTLGAMMLVLMAPLPLFLVGLSRGAQSALVAAGFGTLLIWLLGGWWGMVNYAVTDALPAYLLLRQATLRRERPEGGTEWYPAGRIVLGLSLYAAAIFLGLVLAYAGAEGGLEGELLRLFGAIRDAWRIEAPPAGAQRVFDLLAALIPGLCAGSWLLALTANAALAQGVLIRFGGNLRPSPSLASFDLPRWLAAAAALSAAAGLALGGTAGFVGRNLFLMLILPYFFGGLAVLHGLVRRSGARAGSLVLLYAVLGAIFVVLSWLAILGIAALGFIDQAAGLRRRLMRPRAGPSDGWE